MNNIIKYKVEKEDEKIRLDKYISEKNEDLSRAMVQKLIKENKILVNGKIAKESYKIVENDEILIEIEPPKDAKILAEDIPLEIIYEDNDIIIINKPKGLIVHKGSGTSDITLADILEYNYNNLPGEEGRKGIVHRLDKDTTGLMIIAKTENAMNKLIQDFKEKNIVKKYVCIVRGEITDDAFTIKFPISRDLKNRHKMCVSRDRKRSNNKSKENMGKKSELLNLR